MNTAGAETLQVCPRKNVKNIAINSWNVFFLFVGSVSVWFFRITSFLTWNKKNTNSRKTTLLEFFWKSFKSDSEILSFSSFQQHYWKETPFLAVFIVFICLSVASSVQRWIRQVQKCSSLNQLWPEISKLKSAGTTLNIAGNAKISKSSLKMNGYL